MTDRPKLSLFPAAAASRKPGWGSAPAKDPLATETIVPMERQLELREMATRAAILDWLSGTPGLPLGATVTRAQLMHRERQISDVDLARLIKAINWRNQAWKEGTA